MKVMPTSCWIFFNSTCICLRILASRAPRGSSRRRTFGSLTRALAMATRCCCPPERSVTSLFSKPSSPTIFSILFTFCSMTVLSTFFRFSPKPMFSATFKWGKRAYFWNTVLTSLLYGGSLEISIPLNSTSPSLGSSKPAMIRRVVVFPHPLGPKSVRNSFS